MLSPDHVEKLKSVPEWIALQAHIDECIIALDSCSSIPDGADFALQAQGRKEAVKILNKILEPFYYDPKPLADKRDESLRKLGML